MTNGAIHQRLLDPRLTGEQSLGIKTGEPREPLYINMNSFNVIL